MPERQISGNTHRQGATRMQNIQELKESIKGILDSQKLAVLATQKDGNPYGSLVAFAATADMKTILFATTRATRKYANLLTDPGVALVIDTRTNQSADFSDAAAITVLGEVEEVAGHKRQEFVEIYLDKHHYLKEFVESPTTALLSVKVKTYIMVNQFQNVQELQM
jgi:nitroimidazol reductase NimA-like FMN-containing flavoprotein (pyridoxamine 5'-phosphate oxidase superfamily)